MKNLLPSTTTSLIFFLFLTSLHTNAQELNKVQSNFRDLILCLCGPTVLTESSYQIPYNEGRVITEDLTADATLESAVIAEWYLDKDNDGLGNPLEVQISYAQPLGYVANSNDTDDNLVDRLCSTTKQFSAYTTN